MEDEVSEVGDPLMRDVLRATFQPGYTWLDMERATYGRAFSDDMGLVVKTLAYAVVAGSELIKSGAFGLLFHSSLELLL